MSLFLSAIKCFTSVASYFNQFLVVNSISAIIVYLFVLKPNCGGLSILWLPINFIRRLRIKSSSKKAEKLVSCISELSKFGYKHIIILYKSIMHFRQFYRLWCMLHRWYYVLGMTKMTSNLNNKHTTSTPSRSLEVNLFQTIDFCVKLQV